MRAPAFVAGLLLAGISTSAFGQNWMYGSGPNGTPPFAYQGPGYSQPYQPPYEAPRVQDWSLSTPAVPRVESYVPPPSWPSSQLPCTMPGCR